MKIAGIIAEYNPFHKGHQYQIREIRKLGFDYVITAISGDFVQRGAPAVIDKYTRAEMALSGGADLVLELPAVYATASAETFAKGGVQTLAATGLVDTVSFGMEQPDTRLLLQLADLFTDEPGWYREKLKEGLRTGLSYPAARSRALPEYADFLASPNNILALEYARAVKKYAPGTKLLPIQRYGSGHHQTDLADGISSASAIRSQLQRDFYFSEIRSQTEPPEVSPLVKSLPESSLRLLMDYQKNASLLYEEDLSLPLHCCLIGQTLESLTAFSDISPALAGRILAMRKDFTSFSGFCNALKTKDQTYTRISRALLHLLLHITDDLISQAEHVQYIRLLGFRRSAAPLLGKIQQQQQIPLITSLAKAVQRDSEALPAITGCSSKNALLTSEAQAILQTDLYAHDLYRALLTARTGRAWPNEFQQKMLVAD